MGISDAIPYEASSFDLNGLHPAFCSGFYRFRRRIFEMLSARVDVFDSFMRRVLYCQERTFSIRKDIRLYSDPSKVEELLAIQAREIIGPAVAYDVWDQTRGELVGTLRTGWTTGIYDRWEICGPDGQVIGRLREEEGWALVRLFTSRSFSQSFRLMTLTGELAAQIRKPFDLFIYWLNVDLMGGSKPLIDPRLVLAAATLLTVIEGHQD